MWWGLDEGIFDSAKRLIREHETYVKSVLDENARRTRRSTLSQVPLAVKRPQAWAVDPGFNPYLVRARRGAIAHAITASMRNRSYSPRPPAGFEVPKSSGGSRVVSTFQIADEVVSNRLLRSLTRKNLPRISARAYAYRPDLTPHDAIGYIKSEFAREHRVFVAEYDFSKFFDTVDHAYLLDTLDRVGIVRTPLEQFLIQRFLESPEPCLPSELEGLPRVRGIPQGTSVSLFLANVAAADLDRELERIGVGFVRYADDTLMWSADYGRICDAAAALHHVSDKIGSEINVEKSPGVSLLVKERAQDAEIRTTKSIDYLGHTIGLRSTRMKASTIERIKSKIEHLIFVNLLLEPLRKGQAATQLTDVDRDYVTLIWQIRRYLYGPLSENDIRRFQHGSIPPMSFEGVMSFFPLIDDDAGLFALDTWMASQIWLAMRKRERLLFAASLACPPPLGLSKEELIGFQSKSKRTGASLDLRMPSFRKIAGVIRTAVSTHGLGVVSGKAPLYLYVNNGKSGK
ncbi:reverse transcriptase domain-containing protein [Nocardia sp. NPDC058518]|uniref:reverse transcriptase domain-containing protein n=1 Tax=Nocardia sp. NPDC058518 TaxID=3346534 RepID=UPI0036672145